MNTATITKTLKNLEAQPASYSLGFARLMALPNNARKNLRLSFYLNTGSIHTHQEVIDFLASKNETEFKLWLATN